MLGRVPCPIFVTCRLAAMALSMTLAGSAFAQPAIQVWVSSEDLSQRLSPQPALSFGSRPRRSSDGVEVDPGTTYQRILGMGSSLEPTTCFNLSRLPEAERRATLRRLVHPEDGIGMNLMRICIGTPDFTGDPWYSLNDTPDGSPDPDLTHFSIERDRAYILPVLQMALEENPALRFFASPWSPSGWMTSTGDMVGGHLLPEYYDAYARYFARFVRAYEAEGIPIHAVTVQNEPGVDRSKERDPKWHYPSCRWTGEQERDFIANHLGPVFEAEGLKTEIWTYDHNYNERATVAGDDPGIAYPRVVLSDPRAARYVGGVAFHGYAGRPEGMARFHEEFPDTPIYFTEGSMFGLRGARRIVELFQNFASSYNAWVTMIDERGGPNNGPFQASRTCITLDSTQLSVEYHFDYFMYGQFMRFVPPGARRIAVSARAKALDAVAFVTPEERIVLITVNGSDSAQSFTILHNNRGARAQLPAKSVATFMWPLE